MPASLKPGGRSDSLTAPPSLVGLRFALEPENPEILCNLGATLVDLGDLDTAIGHFRDAIRLKPGFRPGPQQPGERPPAEGRQGSPRSITFVKRCGSTQRRARLARIWEGCSWSKASRRKRWATAAMSLSFVPAPPRPETASAMFTMFWGSSTRPRAVSARRSDSSRVWPPRMRDSERFSRSSASSTGRRHHSARPCDTTPVTPAPWLDWPPGCERSFPQPTWPRSRACWRSPTCPRSSAGLCCSDWPSRSTRRRDFDRAAALTLQANALQLADFQQRGRGYDPGAHRRFVDRLIEVFDPDFFARMSGSGVDTERPVFVVGMPRSGTTLIEQILASHPRVFGAASCNWYVRRSPRCPRRLAAPSAPLDCVPFLDRHAAQSLASQHLSRLSAIDNSADRVVDKMPENTLYLGLIAALFPRARLIHCRRDVRDVALSCWMTHFAHVRWACDPQHIASRIQEYQRVMTPLADACSRCRFSRWITRPWSLTPSGFARARGLVRPGMEPGMPGVSQDAAPCANDERRPGPPAALPAARSVAGRITNGCLQALFAELEVEP